MSGWNKQLNGLELNTEEQIHSLEFATSQEAWEKLNEGFLCYLAEKQDSVVCAQLLMIIVAHYKLKQMTA